MQRDNPYDENALDHVPQLPHAKDPSLPTDAELRTLAKAVRRKAPGPDGIPPYILAHLPETAFHSVCEVLRLIIRTGEVPRWISDSVTLPLFKGKGKWYDPTRWRPIAMSNSIYRLLARWILSIIRPQLEATLSPQQFGGLQGRSPGMATCHLLDNIARHPDLDTVIQLDLFHAFDSPPKVLLCRLLQKRGLPMIILPLLTSILSKAHTRLQGTTGGFFPTLCRVKQGCPLSGLGLIFETYFQVFLDQIT